MKTCTKKTMIEDLCQWRETVVANMRQEQEKSLPEEEWREYTHRANRELGRINWELLRLEG